MVRGLARLVSRPLSKASSRSDGSSAGLLPCAHTRIARLWKLQRHRAQDFQLVHEHTDQPRVSWNCPIQHPDINGVQNQFPQKRRHIHHATLPRQRLREGRFEVQAPHREPGRRLDSAFNSCRYPHRSVRRYDPRTFLRMDAHHAFRRVNQPVPLAPAGRKRERLRKTHRVRTDLDAGFRIGGRRMRLACSRHSLTVYRKTARPPIPTLRPATLRVREGHDDQTSLAGGSSGRCDFVRF